MESSQIDQAVARFIDTITVSAESAQELASKGLDAGVTFGSELITQVLMFNGIKAGIIAFTCFALAILCALFVRKSINQINSSPMDFMPAGFVEPDRREVEVVLDKNGVLHGVRGIDGDGDAIKRGGGFIFNRSIVVGMTNEQAREYREQIAQSGGLKKSMIQSLHGATDGVMSWALLAGLTVVAVFLTLHGVDNLIELIKITVAPYLYLMEYAVDMKGKM